MTPMVLVLEIFIIFWIFLLFKPYWTVMVLDALYFVTGVTKTSEIYFDIQGARPKSSLPLPWYSILALGL